MIRIDWYFDVISPYAYLAFERLPDALAFRFVWQHGQLPDEPAFGDLLRALGVAAGALDAVEVKAALRANTEAAIADEVLIASGPQTSSLLLGLCATWFTARGESVGLEFSFRFRKAVRAGDTLRLSWTITAIEPKPSLNGDVVSMEGRAVNGAGDVVVESRGLALLAPAKP